MRNARWVGYIGRCDSWRSSCICARREPPRMPNDHYVAETYLKHFAGPSGMLRAARKRDGKCFPCRPHDICRERDGDVIPDFLSDPEYLKLYRGMFEPAWNHAVRALETKSLLPGDKLALAGYWANLMTCTPTWRRIGLKLHSRSVLDSLGARDELLDEAGRPDHELKEALAALRSGRFRLETEPDYVRAVGAKQLLGLASALYHADWTVLVNDTGIPFLTSDNPAAFEDQGPWRGRPAPFVRYLPITPRLCLMCDLAKAKSREHGREPDLTRPPRGQVRGAEAQMPAIRRVNQTVVRCAEDLVLTADGAPQITRHAASVATENASFRADVEYTALRIPDGFLFGHHVRVLEQAPLSDDRTRLQEPTRDEDTSSARTTPGALSVRHPMPATLNVSQADIAAAGTSAMPATTCLPDDPSRGRTRAVSRGA